MALFLYNLFLTLYKSGISIASLWNKKARLWIKGRKDQPLPAFAEKRVWMHCSSLGEFEQGRPVLEAIKKQYPHYRIILTFFSPSGYEIRKNYAGADSVLYLPMDARRKAQQFVKSIDPALVIWVKYEYWFYYLNELKKKKVPVLLISGIFRPSQPFFKWYGKIWIRMLGSFHHLFVQNERSYQLLADLNIKNITVSGDTRFDRVIDIAETLKQIPMINNFCGTAKVIVAGSTWEEDEEVLIHYAKSNPHIKFIIAPHEVDKENLNDVKKEFPDSVFYSQLNNSNNDHQVLIIDNIGLLSALYRYATVTYVGGGFRSGIHNILEAAVYHKPVVFGPEYEKFDEAVQLIEKGCAFSIETALELEKVLDDLLNNNTEAGRIAGEFVYNCRGATGKIMGFIQANRLLTN